MTFLGTSNAAVAFIPWCERLTLDWIVSNCLDADFPWCSVVGKDGVFVLCHGRCDQETWPIAEDGCVHLNSVPISSSPCISKPGIFQVLFCSKQKRKFHFFSALLLLFLKKIKRFIFPRINLTFFFTSAVFSTNKALS